MTVMPAGRYESHFLRAVDPARPRAAWIRRTTHQRPGEPATGALWCTVWDAEAGPPFAVKQSYAALLPDRDRPTPQPKRWTGRAEALGRRAAWDLEPAGSEPPLRHLAHRLAYRAPLPRTKLESPRPDAVFNGWVETGADGRVEAAGADGGVEAAGSDRGVEVAGADGGVEAAGPLGRVEVAGWRGVVGHNWGTEHAERWVWLHALGFAEAPGAWLDLALGRVKAAGRTSPWIANGALSLDGARLRLGGLRHARSVTADARPGAFEAEIGGFGVRIRVRAAAPAGQTVAFEYADPAGGEHHALNCSIAEVHLRVERPGRPPLELATAHGGAYELGVRETTHGVPLEPFADP